MSKKHEISLADAVNRFVTAFYKRAESARFGDGINDLKTAVHALEAVYEREAGLSGVPRQPYENKPSTYADTGSGTGHSEHHESYGLVGFSRVMGQVKLFGSAVNHQHFIQLEILRARKESTASGEHFTSTHQASIIRVFMSSAQFAEAITAMNHGGTPCTINMIEGVKMDPVPEGSKSEMHEIQDQFEQRINKLRIDAESHLSNIDTILEKKSLTKADRDAIRQNINDWSRHVADSAPFLMRMFHESAEKTITKAKTEVESFVNAVAQRMGIKALKDVALLQLGGDRK